MKKILAFGASNSSQSINRQLASFAAHQLKDVDVSLLDLNDFEMPIFSVDREKATGIPEKAQQFTQLIGDHDAIVVSLAEHNSGYPAAFKNIIDWTSRLEGKLWQDKPMFLLSASPGKRGGANVMETALKYLPYMGANIQANFSLPSFYQNFSEENGISDEPLRESFNKQLQLFREALFTAV